MTKAWSLGISLFFLTAVHAQDFKIPWDLIPKELSVPGMLGKSPTDCPTPETESKTPISGCGLTDYSKLDPEELKKEAKEELKKECELRSISENSNIAVLAEKFKDLSGDSGSSKPFASAGRYHYISNIASLCAKAKGKSGSIASRAQARVPAKAPVAEQLDYMGFCKADYQCSDAPPAEQDKAFQKCLQALNIAATLPKGSLPESKLTPDQRNMLCWVAVSVKSSRVDPEKGPILHDRPFDPTPAGFAEKTKTKIFPAKCLEFAKSGATEARFAEACQKKKGGKVMVKVEGKAMGSAGYCGTPLPGGSSQGYTLGECQYNLTCDKNGKPDLEKLEIKDVTAEHEKYDTIQGVKDTIGTDADGCFTEKYDYDQELVKSKKDPGAYEGAGCSSVGAGFTYTRNLCKYQCTCINGKHAHCTLAK